MRQNVLTTLQTTALLLSLGIAAHAQRTRITDVPNGSTNFFTAGNFVYFTANGSLRRTDGTDTGTSVLRSGFTPLSAFAEFNDMLVLLIRASRFG